MKIFHCDHCDQLVFFENTQCVSCGHLLAFLPDLAEIGSLERDDDDGLAFTARGGQRADVPPVSELPGGQRL